MNYSIIIMYTYININIHMQNNVKSIRFRFLNNLKIKLISIENT